MAKALTLRPQPGPQEAFLSTPADVAFYGGAAGGGKTFALLLEPLRHISRVDGFGAVIFRRTTPQITNEGGLWDESLKIYPLLDAEERVGRLDWTFPPYNNGVKFAHMERETNRLDWKSSQIPLIIFDQLEDFSRKQFFYMFSRNRSTCGVRPYIRGGYNPVPPDDPTGGWLHEFVGWYLDGEGYPDMSRAGRMRWFVNLRDTLHWFESREAAQAAHPEIPPKSFTFIPASVFDNKILLDRDPGYLANLYALDNIDQERLLRANHKIRPEAGTVFRREWFHIVDQLPQTMNRAVRFWDFAATERKRKAGAATASVKMALDREGHAIVLDVTEDWLGPAAVDDYAVSVARQDGAAVSQRWEEEGGSAGKRTTATLAAKMAGLDCGGVRPTGDKLARSRPLAAQARAGNVWLLRAAWNDRFMGHMHAIPDGARWDIHDAAAGAYNMIAGVARPMSSQPEQPSRWGQFGAEDDGARHNRWRGRF